MHNDIIEKLVQLEDEVRNITVDAIEKRENLAKTVNEQCSSIEKKLKDEFDKKLKEAEINISNESQDKILRIKNEKSDKFKLLQEIFDKNKNDWEDEIFNYIISR